ncbi:MAG: PrsW family intramembrane metalloprotease [Leptospiraceae bacterium]|nr:PrsW family intramembrane metalloprotease [Leptospiraceae bacterium]
MDILLLLAISIAPGIFLIYRYYSKDIYKKEPWVIIWKSFFWGAATVLPAGLIESSIEFPGKDTIVGMVIENFFVIALTEELCKYAVIRLYSYRNTHFDETMDGIVYGVAVASGFATFENIFYVIQHGLAVGMLRAVLSVPSHIFEGAIIGYWLAKSKFQNTSPLSATMISLTIVVAAHGFFDFVLTYNNAEYFLLSVIPVILLAWLVKIYVKDALTHDLKHIHVSQEVISISEQTIYSDEEKIEIHTESVTVTNNSNSTDYLQKLIRISLYFLGIVCFLTGSFLLLGFVTLMQEGKEELWTISLAIVPMLLGVFLFYKAKKMNSV